MIIKKIIIFFVDIYNQRKDPFYINRDSSYKIMRFCYRITNGLLINLISIFITKTKYINTKESFKSLENLNDIETSSLKNEINKMRVYNKTEIKKIHYTNIQLRTSDYSFPIDLNNSKKIVRLDVLKKDLFSNKKVSEFALKNEWLNIFKNNFKFEPKLMDITAWYTFPDLLNNKAEHKEEKNFSYDAQIWHRDVDKIRDIKIFIYLTDVNSIDDGPFEILSGTHLFSFKRFKYSNNNNFRILTKDIPSKILKNKVSFTGKKGSNFIVDTRCIHRGAQVKKNHRLVLELYFSNSFFGKHFKFNDFTRPKLDRNWDSYSIWKDKIDKNPKIYKYLFLEH